MSTMGNGAANPGKRIALLILGMHRSGTSALTRTLNLLGADLPRNLYPPSTDNPAGYWESSDWIELHDELLASHGLAWDSSLPLPEDALAPGRIAPFRARLVNLLRRDFANSVLFVAKDPRICRLLPLWHAALEDIGFTARHIIIVRHPIEVVASLAKRRKTSQETALLLWMRHVLEAEHASRGKPRVFVSYDVLLADWRPVVDSIARAFNIDWPIAPESAKAQIEQFLRRDLRHHVAENDLELPRYFWPRSLYQASLASLDNEQGAAATFDEIRQGLIASDELHIDYRDQSQLVAEIQRLTDFNRAEIQRLTDFSRSLNNDLARYRETVTRLQAEAATLCGHIKYRDTEISQLAAEIDRITEIGRSRDNELILHRETVAPVQTEAVILWSHIRYRDTEIGRLKMEIEGLNSIVATAEKRSAYQSEVARLREELAARESELNRLNEETVNLRNQLEKVTTSWTWRATKPLRLPLARKPR